MIAYNEQELIYLYHLGSMRAYEILLSEYRKFIYAYANRYDSGIEYSEDSLQEMMISLSHAFEAYRIDKNTSMRTYFFYVIKSSLSTKKRMVYRKIRYLDDKKKISLDQNIYGTSIKVENVIADTKKNVSTRMPIRNSKSRANIFRYFRKESLAFRKRGCLLFTTRL